MSHGFQTFRYGVIGICMIGVLVWIASHSEPLGAISTINQSTPVEHTKVYWLETDSSVTLTIRACDISDCGLTTTDLVSIEVSSGLQIEATATHLYWLGNIGEAGQRKIQSCEIANCESTITDVLLLNLGPDAFEQEGVEYWHFAVTDTHLFLSTSEEGLQTCELTNCAATLTDLGQSFSFALQWTGITTGP